MVHTLFIVFVATIVIRLGWSLGNKVLELLNRVLCYLPSVFWLN